MSIRAARSGWAAARWGLGGPGLAGGRHALLAGGPGRAGAAAQVAALGGLAAGDAEGPGEIRPAGSRVAGCFDQAGLPPGELLAHLPQQHQGGQRLLRFRAGVFGCVRGVALGVAQGVVDGVEGRRGGEE